MVRIFMKRKMSALLAFTILFSGVAWSQVTFGIRSGVNFQSINGKDIGGNKLDNTLTVRFHLGTDIEVPLASDFYFQPGLLFRTKGTSDDEGKFNLGYIELPLHLLYKPQYGKGKLIIGLGPFIAYGVTGKIKPETSTDIDIKFKSNLTTEELLSEFEGEVFYLKGFDAGADIFFGYQFAFNLYLQIDAQLGILNMWPNYENDENDESVFRNTGFGLSAGYRF